VDRDKRQVEIKSLDAARHNLEDTLSRLQSDLADEETVRRFYGRYWSVGGLMEYLATWDQVIFLRCNNRYLPWRDSLIGPPERPAS